MVDRRSPYNARVTRQAGSVGDDLVPRGEGDAVGPDPREIERIVEELRQAAPDEVGPRSDEPADEPAPTASPADQHATLAETGRLAPLRRVTKLFLGRAIRWQLGSIAVEIQRIGGEVDRWERERESERAEADATIAELRREIAALRDRLRRIERSGESQRALRPTPAPALEVPTATQPDPQTNLDYFAFEALMRGSTDEIADRQSAYLPLFNDVDDILDVGCGRGELLALLAAAGKRVRGVDVNEDMVGQCRDRHLDVQLGDGNSYLASLPEGSLGGVVALQVVEHLTPAQLVTFLERCHRALRPEGLLLLETINPATLSALGNYFADLTHQQPLVPKTLAFLVESAGFHDVRIEYLSPLPEIARLRHIPYGDRVGDGVQAASDRNVDLVNAALFGPQDFAVIARA